MRVGHRGFWTVEYVNLTPALSRRANQHIISHCPRTPIRRQEVFRNSGRVAQVDMPVLQLHRPNYCDVTVFGFNWLNATTNRLSAKHLKTSGWYLCQCLFCLVIPRVKKFERRTKPERCCNVAQVPLEDAIS